MKKYYLLGLFLSALSAQAQDRLFTYTYQSNVLNKGQKELEVHSTMRNTRKHFYRGFDHSLEFEVGFGAKLQSAFYLNYGYSKSIETTENIKKLEDAVNYSFANEWKLKLTDPVNNPIGSALYFEYKLGADEVELESKLIFDKQIGKTIQAFNIVGEYEIAKEFDRNADEIEIETEHEFELNLNYGFAYQINKNLSFGVELLSKNKIEENDLKYSMFSAGPCLSYNFEGFWINLTCLPQVTNFKTGQQELAKNEKIQTRLIFSYVF